MRRKQVKCFGRQEIEEVSGMMQSLDTVMRRDGSLKQLRANNIIKGTNNTLRLVVLGGGVGTQHL